MQSLIINCSKNLMYIFFEYLKSHQLKLISNHPSPIYELSIPYALDKVHSTNNFLIILINDKLLFFVDFSFQHYTNIRPVGDIACLKFVIISLKIED